MFRLVFALALVLALTNPARAEPAPSRFALGVGPAFWLEFGKEECFSDAYLVRSCSSALRDWYGGARTQVDFDLARWLRVGLQFGFGTHAQDYVDAVDDGGETSATLRRWLIPMGVHALAHLEPSNTASLWIGPELLYALRVDSTSTIPLQRVPNDGGGSLQAPLEPDRAQPRDTRSGVLLGVAMGADFRLAGRFWLGPELGLAFSYVQSGQVGRVRVESAMTAVLRAGLLLRISL